MVVRPCRTRSTDVRTRSGCHHTFKHRLSTHLLGRLQSVPPTSFIVLNISPSFRATSMSENLIVSSYDSVARTQRLLSKPSKPMELQRWLEFTNGSSHHFALPAKAFRNRHGTNIFVLIERERRPGTHVCGVLHRIRRSSGYPAQHPRRKNPHQNLWAESRRLNSPEGCEELSRDPGPRFISDSPHLSISLHR